MTKLKGSGYDIPVIVTLMFFLAIGIWLTGQIQQTFPQFQLVSSFDFLFFSAGLISVAGACVIATGLPCAATLGIFSVLQFFAVSNTLIGSLIFIPLSVIVAFIAAKLARGTD
jgi:hypothetical protein